MSQNVPKKERGQQLSTINQQLLLVAEGDTSFREVVRTHFDFDAVTGEDLDVMHTHLAGDVGRNLMPVLQFHSEHGVGEGLHNLTILLNS